MKVLVANRGEIACRILRTLRDMSVPSVAVYTEPDRDAPHVWLADDAEAIGGVEGYLIIDRILDAAKSSKATAIHPGYGFLSQNALFARACRDAGLIFIGPSAESMAALGDKKKSRAMAEKLGVPVIPGAINVDMFDDAKEAADAVGYPILLKAAGGGGGKGMRLVRSSADLAEAFEGARREAKSSFADDRIFVEKYIFPARHVEVQILGDGKDAITLGERECSLQRRYQKVIEESPAHISSTTRVALVESAIKIARAAAYANAATVEFLVAKDGSHYFLEVNTRLQVEHAVTELRTGLDLVRMQIEIAHGMKVPPPPTLRGHAIEARLNAEEPYRGFLPSSGKVLMLEWPQRPGLRIDAGIREGSAVLPFYDPLIAKIIAWGHEREDARLRLAAALRELTLLGVATNQAFLLQILEEEFFKRGETHTSTLESREWKEPPAHEAAAMFAARVMSAPETRAAQQQGGTSDPWSPWRSLGGFRMGL